MSVAIELQFCVLARGTQEGNSYRSTISPRSFSMAAVCVGSGP